MLTLRNITQRKTKCNMKKTHKKIGLRSHYATHQKSKCNIKKTFKKIALRSQYTTHQISKCNIKKTNKKMDLRWLEQHFLIEKLQLLSLRETNCMQVIVGLVFAIIPQILSLNQKVRNNLFLRVWSEKQRSSSCVKWEATFFFACEVGSNFFLPV